ncbi:MAG: alpha/beta fold hydrolase [Acidimicrobiia bacterium]
MRIRVDDGVELAVLDTGRGESGQRPTLVLVHGFGGGMVDFVDHVEAFDATHRVVTFDLRGHGASEGPEEPSRYSLDRFVRDVLAVLDALGVERFRLLGHSMGGMVARRLAGAVPHRLDALVLMDTAAGPLEWLDREEVAFAAQVAREQGMAILKELLDAAAPLETSAYRRLIEARPEYVELQEQRFASLSAAMWSTVALELVEQPDETHVLQSVSAPTLVVVGELDELFLDAAHHIAAVVPLAELAVIAEAGHSPQVETPAAWFEIVHGFLERLGDAGPGPREAPG